MVLALEETQRLIDGRLHTKESVVEEYENLVHHCSNRLKVYAKKSGFSYDDVVQEGFIGLLRAFENFDESRGLKFMTIAYQYVNGFIQNAIRDRGGDGLNYSNRIKEIAYEIQREELEDEPINEITVRLDRERHHIVYALKYLKDRNPARLDATVFTADDELTIKDVVGYEEDETVYYVNDFLRTLNDRERDVLSLRLYDKTQTEIGELIGVHRVQVYRVLKRIKEKYLAFEKEGVS